MKLPRLAAFVILAIATLAPQARAERLACVAAALDAEAALGVPAGLGVAIALVESGRDGAPYPYAMNVDGTAVYAADAAQAASHMRDGAGKLRRNVMVGCMQLSLKYHRKAFASDLAMIDPGENARYGVRHLADMRKKTGSWTKALEAYNGGSPKNRVAYRCKVRAAALRVAPDTAKLIDAAGCPASGPRIAASAELRKAIERARLAEPPWLRAK